MRRSRTDPLALDDASVERLLAGTLPAAAAPAGYARVARLLAATVAPPTPQELAGEAAALAEFRAVTGGRRAATTASPARPRRRRAGLAVVVVVGALATGGVAAATGHLPGPVREAARTVLGPGGAATPSGPAPTAQGTTTAGSDGAGPGGSASTVGQDPRSGPAAAGPAAGPALDGLCQAFQEGKGGDHGGKLDAAAFAKLAAAAGGDDQVEAFCEELLGADAKVKGPKDSKPKDPPDDPGQGQGGAPPSSGGGSGTGGGGSDSGGSGQAQSSPVPAPLASPPNRG